MPSWPDGVITTTLIFGKGITAGGNMTSARLTVEPMFQGTDAVVWQADGTPMLPFQEQTSADDGSYGSIPVPVVDQDGWLDSGQHAYKLWGYKLTENPSFGRSPGKQRVKYWQPLTGQTTVDFDLIPDGTLGLPVAGPTASVTSINGITGALTSQDLADAGFATTEAIQSQVTAAVTALTAGAPGALDTLNELAAAFGNDANFSTSVATALANRVVVLTVVGTKTGTYTANPNELVPVDATTTPVTVTLPAAPSTATRITVKKIDTTANVVTIARGGTDVFNKTGGSTTLTLSLQNQSATVQYAAGVWYVSGGDLPLSSLQPSLAATYVPRTEAPVVTVTGLSASAGTAAANTALIQAALNAAEYREVFIPPGIWPVTSITIPGFKSLTGSWGRKYFTNGTIPTVYAGTVLSMSDATQTTPVITMGDTSRLENLAILGSGSTCQATGVFSAGHAVIRDITVQYAKIGIDGAYTNTTIENVEINSCVSHGITKLVDSRVVHCIINANNGRGIDMPTGSNSNVIANNKVEWNVDIGISCFSANDNVILGNFIDRNGKGGITVKGGSTNISVMGNTSRRNGRLSQAGTDEDDSNIALSSGTGIVVSGNTTRYGYDDDGTSGYQSPRNAFYITAPTASVVSMNVFTGGVTQSIKSAGDISAAQFSKNAVAGATQYLSVPVVDRPRESLASSNTAAGASFTHTITLPLVINEVRTMQLRLTGRNGGTNAGYSATAWLTITRAAATANISIDGLTNLKGTAFALTGGSLNVSAADTSSGSDGTTVTITIANALAVSANLCVETI
jgi:parallel beta helix pectate lyase-like protein